MTAPVAAKVTSVIDKQIAELLLMLPRYLSSGDERVLGWFDELQKAMPAGRKDAFLSMAAVHHLSGDLRAALAAVERAKTNGADDATAAACLLPIYLNLGYATRAVECSVASIAIRNGNVTGGLPSVAMSGAFSFVRQLLEQAEMANLNLSSVPQIDEIRAIAAAAQRLGFDDESFSRVLDIAGTVMRDRELFWLEASPHLFYDDEMEVVAVRYMVAVSPEDAASMNSRTIDGLIEANLENVPLSVAFVGVLEEVEA